MSDSNYGDGPYQAMFMKQRSQSLEIVEATCQFLQTLCSLGVNDILLEEQGTVSGSGSNAAALARVIDADKHQREAIAQAASNAYGHVANMDAEFSPDDVLMVIDLARDSRRILTSVAQGRIEEAVQNINDFFREKPMILHIMPGPPWTVHHHLDGDWNAAGKWRTGTLVAISYLIETGAWNRIGVCQAQGCSNLFVDATKNRSKKYCSLACLQRDKIRKYRTRQREQLEHNRQDVLATSSVFSYG